jgi:pantoate--beta-alanine ligase
MSSRNAYLSPEERRAAVCLFRSLSRATCMVKRGESQARIVTRAVRAEIAKEPLARLEYVSFCDSATLEEIEEIHESALLALAVWIGKTRLIDNTILQR